MHPCRAWINPRALFLAQLSRHLLEKSPLVPAQARHSLLRDLVEYPIHLRRVLLRRFLSRHMLKGLALTKRNRVAARHNLVHSARAIAGWLSASRNRARHVLGFVRYRGYPAPHPADPARRVEFEKNPAECHPTDVRGPVDPR